MLRGPKIIVGIITVSTLVFLWLAIGHEDLEDPEVLELRQSALIQPKVGSEISESAKTEYLLKFESLKQKLQAEGFENLKDLETLAELKRSLGDTQGAADVFTYMGLIRPQNAFSFASLGLLYHHDLKKYDLAEKNYLIALSNDSDDTQTVRNLFDLYWKGFGNLAKAEALLLESIKANPSSADLYVLGGNFYSSLGKKEKALEFFEKHMELNPHNGVVMKEIERLKSEIGQ